MKVSRLEKEVDTNKGQCKITLEITLDAADFATFDYQGYDMIEDKMIPDILLAVSRRLKIKNGKLSPPPLMEKISTVR